MQFFFLPKTIITLEKVKIFRLLFYAFIFKKLPFVKERKTKLFETEIVLIKKRKHVIINIKEINADLASSSAHALSKYKI